MKRKFTILTAALALLAFLAIPMGMRGQTTETVTLSNGTFSNDHITWTCASNGITIQQLKGNSSTAVNSSYISAPRVYKGHVLSFVGSETIKIKQIDITVNGNYYGNSMTAGTVYSNNTVTDNTTDVARTWTTTSGGTHVVSSVSTEGLSAIYIQNVASATNIQLRPSAISITYIVSDDTPTTYTITFDAGDGNFVGSTDFPNASNTVAAGTYTLPSAERSGYTFDGWVTGNNEPITGSYTVSGNVAFTAAYTENTTPTPGGNLNLTFDLRSNPGSWPTSASTTLTNFDYTLAGVDYTFALNNVYCNSGYLMLKSVAVLGLPAIEGYKLTTVVAHNSNGCSTSTKVGISSSATQASYIAGGAAQTWSTQGSTYTYNLTSTEENTMYYLYVTNKNAQLFSLDLTYEAVAATTVATPTFDPASGTEFGDEGLNVSITCETNDASIYYTLNGDTPNNQSTLYNGAISVTETTTIKAIAFDGTNYSNVATATYTYVDPNAPGTVNNPYTVAQARAAIDANAGTQGVYATGIVSQIVAPWGQNDYQNITFNMVDEEGDQVFLQAFRCVGTQAPEVAVGDVAVVSGNLTKYGSTYEFAQGCQVVSLTHPSILAPVFSVAAGGYAVAQSVELSCETSNAVIYYTLDGSDPTSTSTQYNGAISVTETTTIKAIAYVGAGHSPVAEAAYYILSDDNVYTVTDALAFSTYPQYNIFVNGIVSTAPDELISGAQLTYYISVDGEATDQLQVYKGRGLNNAAFTSVDDIQVGDIVTIFGNVKVYNNITEFDNGNYLVTFERPAAPAEPSVTVTPNTINAPAEGADGTLALAYENITDFVSFDYYFCDATGEALDEDPEWIYAAINEENDGYSLDYIIYANNDAARTAYMKVYTYDDELEEVYVIVTVNQEEYVAPVLDYAELPFAFDGGRADIETTDGLTQSGLDSDYSSSPKLKFKTTGTWVILHFNERPGTLTFDIKGNSFSGGTFTVQTSEDGVTYTDLENYTDANFGNTLHSEEFTNLGENVRYIKWIYTEKSSGNVALGNITLAEYTEPVLVASITVDPDEVSVNAEEHDGTLGLTYENLPITEMTDFDIQYYDAEGEEANVPDWIEVLVAEQSPEIGEGYVVSYWIMENEGAEARTVYFKVYAMDDETNLVYSNLVTVTQAAPEVPATPGTWVLTSLADLTEDDIFVIVGNNGDTYAMSNDEGTQHAPSTVAVTVTEGTLSGEPDANIQWNLEITDGGYIFHPNGTTETWLYCTNDNNGVRVGTGDAKHFTFDETYGDGYLTTTETTDQRWIGIYNSQDWRCYKLGTNGDFPSNIAGQTFSFYKKVYTLDITGYGTSAGGYYLIASPVTVNPANVVGMTEGHFDLFRFNESADYEWENWKVEGDHYHFNLVPGQGYLYAHKTDVTLTFTGTPYNGESIILSKTDGNGIDWPGWNLVGNPYGVMAYLDRDFYTMNDAGDEIVAATNNSVQVMEGVFVIANFDGEELTFSTEAPAASGEKIVVNVSNTNGKLLDRAMIRFGEGGQLPKFQINENSTKLYINEGEEEFAVVRCINESSTPVSFRPAENGTYTLSINTENVEMEYLHLIDNFTGADIDLLATPSYTFESNTTDNVDRFAVVYTATTSVNENNAKPFAFFNGSEWVIMNEGNATMQVVDVTGRVISTETLNGNATINLIQVPGVYMIRLVNGNDVKVQKVVVK